jgi:hypothetical protein
MNIAQQRRCRLTAWFVRFDPAPVKNSSAVWVGGQTPAGDPPPQFLTLRSVVVPYPTTRTLANTIRRHAATDLDR